MNAYELADRLDGNVWGGVHPDIKKCSKMLRQQADRIAELEKWYFAASKDCLDAADRISQLEKPVKQLSDEYWKGFEAGKHHKVMKAIYNNIIPKPVKQLSDEEIELIVKGWFNCHPEESLTSEFAMPLYSVVNLLKQLLRRLQNERQRR